MINDKNNNNILNNSTNNNNKYVFKDDKILKEIKEIKEILIKREGICRICGTETKIYKAWDINIGQVYICKNCIKELAEYYNNFKDNWR